MLRGKTAAAAAHADDDKEELQEHAGEEGQGHGQGPPPEEEEEESAEEEEGSDEEQQEQPAAGKRKVRACVHACCFVLSFVSASLDACVLSRRTHSQRGKACKSGASPRPLAAPRGVRAGALWGQPFPLPCVRSVDSLSGIGNTGTGCLRFARYDRWLPRRGDEQAPSKPLFISSVCLSMCLYVCLSLSLRVCTDTRLSLPSLLFLSRPASSCLPRPLLFPVLPDHHQPPPPPTKTMNTHKSRSRRAGRRRRRLRRRQRQRRRARPRSWRAS